MNPEKPVVTGRIDECFILEVIYIKFLRGTGVDGDPLRSVEQWRKPTGELIAERDSCEATK